MGQNAMKHRIIRDQSMACGSSSLIRYDTIR